MTLKLTQIWRHPVKAIGREALESVELEAGSWLPNDRVWAVTHERSKIVGHVWEQKINFLRGVTDANLMAVTCSLDDASGLVTMTHPKGGDISFNPEGDVQPFLRWLDGIWSTDLPRPTGLYRASQAQLTDVPDPWISIGFLPSNRALSQRIGHELSPDRWRANLWIDGTAPWEEKDWEGRVLRIGDTVVRITCEITRCKATMANPISGRRDADTLGALADLGHQEFGLYAEVIESGRLRLGDVVKTP